MSLITEYKCINCGLELTDDGRRFYYDDKSQQTIEFILLMSTAGCDNGSKIKGRAIETYCGECKRYLKIYIIEECEDISDSCDVVMEGVKNYMDEYPQKISELKEIRKNPKYTIEKGEFGEYILSVPEFNDFTYSNLFDTGLGEKEALKYLFNHFHESISDSIRYYEEIYERYSHYIYLIADKSDDSGYDSLEKLNCPECGDEIFINFSSGMPCPNCEFPLASDFGRLVD